MISFHNFDDGDFVMNYYCARKYDELPAGEGLGDGVENAAAAAGLA